MAEPLKDELAGPDDGVQAHVSKMFGRDSLYMVMWAVQLGAAALFTPINTRLLGAGRFGRVAAAIAVTQVVYAFGNLQLQAAIQRRYEQSGEDQARRLIMLAVFLAVGATGIAYATGPLWSRALGFGQFDGSAQWAVVWGGLIAAGGGGLGLLKSEDRLGAFCTVTLLQSVGGQALAMAFVLGLHRTASTFVLGLLAGQALATAVSLRCAPPKWGHRGDLRIARAALAYSIPLVPGAIAAFVLNVADRLILQSKLGPVAVGRYQVAYNLGSLAITLLGGLNLVWMPRIFAIKDDATRASVLAATRDSVYGILLPVVVGLSIGAPLLLKLWTPPSYQPDGLLVVLTVVAVSALPYAGSLAHTRVLLASGRTWALAWTFVVAAAVNIVLNFVLIPPWHIAGSTAATLASYIVLSALIRWQADRESKLTAIPWPTGVLLVLGTGCVFLWSEAPTSTPWLVLRGALAASCLLWFVVVGRALIAQPKAEPPRDQRGAAAEPVGHTEGPLPVT